jgi:TldD protein
MPSIDPSFLELPLHAIADAAIDRGGTLGASHVEVRVGRTRAAALRVRDARLESASQSEESGLGVRVIHDGVWGFAAGSATTPEAAEGLVAQAVEVARMAALVGGPRVSLAPEPVHRDAIWCSDYAIDPFETPLSERTARLSELSSRMLGAGVDQVDATLDQVQDLNFYADSTGTTITQQIVRLHPQWTAVQLDRTAGTFHSMRTLGPATARGWEYLHGAGWDWDAEIDALPELLREHAGAPPVVPGDYDLVVDPSNLWLTIHESVGHATELDRVLGDETAFAGTSFAAVEDLGSLHYGSSVMHVTGDRTAPHGLATVGFDAEGVAAQQFDIVRDGLLVGYQLNRQMAARLGLERSNGCAYAAGAGSAPLQRMPNVSLAPDPDGPSTAELIARVTRGIYVVGNGSWSIDMQRLNFQFTGQRFHLIEDGQLTGQLRDVAYQGSTPAFWSSLEAVGGPQTYYLGGTFQCGKGQPGQGAPVSHGSPSALFRGIRVLNTRGVP